MFIKLYKNTSPRESSSHPLFGAKTECKFKTKCLTATGLNCFCNLSSPQTIPFPHSEKWMGLVTRTAKIKETNRYWSLKTVSTMQWSTVHRCHHQPYHYWDDISSNPVQGWRPVLGYWQPLSLRLSLQWRVSWKYSIISKAALIIFWMMIILPNQPKEEGPRKKPSPWRADSSLFLFSRVEVGGTGLSKGSTRRSWGGGRCWVHRWREIICVCSEDGP